MSYYPLIVSGVITFLAIIATIIFLTNRRRFSMEVLNQGVALAVFIPVEGLRDNYIFLINRNRTYYNAQHNYTITSLLINGLSIIYTFATAISLAAIDLDLTSKTEVIITSGILSIFAFAFVMLNILLRPSLRVAQFLVGWRRLDKKVHRINEVINKDIDIDELRKRLDDAMETYFAIEDNVSVHEMS